MKRIAYILTLLILTSCHLRNSWECEGNCYNGEGIKKWKDGGIEKGTWINGDLVGQGYQLFGKNSDFAGDYYEGEFQNGYHGFGTYYSLSDDATYNGFWKNSKPDGNGKITYGPNSDDSGGYYDGEWKDGKYHGYGIRFWKIDGKKYEGYWHNGEMNGYGKCEWIDEGTYIGHWKNDHQNGDAIYILLNGDTIKSNWVDSYSREVALALYGETAETFKILLDSLYNVAAINLQLILDASNREFDNQANNSNYKIDFPSLKQVNDSVLSKQQKIIARLKEIEEYDSKVKLQGSLLTLQYSFLDVILEIENWITLNIESSKGADIQEAYDNITRKHKIATKNYKNFNKTALKFIEKILE